MEGRGEGEQPAHLRLRGSVPSWCARAEGRPRLAWGGGLSSASRPIQRQRRGGAWPALAGSVSARGLRRVAAVRVNRFCPRHGVCADPAFSPASGHRRARCAEVSPAAHASAALASPQTRSAPFPRDRRRRCPTGFGPPQEDLPGRGPQEVAGAAVDVPGNSWPGGMLGGGKGESRRTWGAADREGQFAAVNQTGGVPGPWRSLSVTAATARETKTAGSRDGCL